MRSYHHFCAVARALDVVGDRWSLLVIRELLMRDCRFADLRTGLPGIATNLLSTRLRDLQAAGLVERVDPEPPVATPVYRLTARGRAAEPMIREIGRFGLPEMVRGPEGDAARPHWLAMAMDSLYNGRIPESLAGRTMRLEADGEAMTLELTPDGMHPAPDADPDVTVSGETEAVMGALAGHPDGLAQVEVSGERRLLKRLNAASPLTG